MAHWVMLFPSSFLRSWKLKMAETLKPTQLLPWEDDANYLRLVFLPMAMRFKLDVVGLKLHLKQWQAFPLEARQALLAFPCESPEDCLNFTTRLQALAKKHTAETLEPLPAALDLTAGEKPEGLTDKLRPLGFDLPEDLWKQAPAYARYLLTKIGLSAKASPALPKLAHALNLPRS